MPYLAPKTASLNPLAAVKRRRVRAGILICSPVAGFRPMRALLLRLRKTPRPLSRSTPSFLSCLTTRAVSSSSSPLDCFFSIPTFPARYVVNCACVISSSPPPRKIFFGYSTRDFRITGISDVLKTPTHAYPQTYWRSEDSNWQGVHGESSTTSASHPPGMGLVFNEAVHRPMESDDAAQEGLNHLADVVCPR